MTSTAYLSSDGAFSSFSFEDVVIRFRTPRTLERYTKVVEWDNGCLVVMAKYAGMPETEEYIDLVPILENLYFEPDQFLEPILKVELRYEQ